MGARIDKIVLNGPDEAVAEAKECIAAIDQDYRDATGCEKFGVFTVDGPSMSVCRIDSPSVTEMMIAAAGLAAIDESSVTLVRPIAGDGEATGIVVALGHPYAVAALWAAQSGATSAVTSAILSGATSASKGLFDMHRGRANETEH